MQIPRERFPNPNPEVLRPIHDVELAIDGPGDDVIVRFAVRKNACGSDRCLPIAALIDDLRID